MDLSYSTRVSDSTGRTWMNQHSCVFSNVEVGTGQHCRENVTIFSRQKTVDYVIMSRHTLLWLLHLNTFFAFFLVSEV